MDNGNTQNFELDQLNLDTTSEEWGHNAPERDQRALGNTAITSPETLPDSANPTPETSKQSTPELGQITPVMPPSYEVSAPEPIPHPESKAFSFRPQHAMSGDHLSSQAINTLQDRERELLTDGDIASFADFIDATRDEFQGKETKS